MIIVSALLAALLPLSAVPQSFPHRQSCVRAEREIRRLAPRQVPSLPRPIAGYLHRNGFTIPQMYGDDSPHNVIRGQFDGDGVKDTAVLASRGGFSQILVFWGSTAARVTKLRRRADADFLQTIGDGKIGYSRGIHVVNPKYVLDHYLAYGGPKPPSILHEAIDDGFDGKASEILYYDGRRWHSRQGAD